MAQRVKEAHRTPRGKRASCNGNQHFQEQQTLRKQQNKKTTYWCKAVFQVSSLIYALTPFKAFARRDFWREAAFLWISPLFAALSIFLEAVTNAA
jgi:hypothetical protein